MFVKAMPNCDGWKNPRDIEDIWRVRHFLINIYGEDRSDI
jgi:hypothetical protein